VFEAAEEDMVVEDTAVVVRATTNPVGT
jgi:hypothetical protein